MVKNLKPVYHILGAAKFSRNWDLFVKSINRQKQCHLTFTNGQWHRQKKKMNKCDFQKQMTISIMVDVPVFMGAPEIIVWQKRSHHLSTPRNWAMEFHQLPNQLDCLSSNIYLATWCHQWHHYDIIIFEHDSNVSRASTFTRVNGSVSCLCNKRLQKWPTV